MVVRTEIGDEAPASRTPFTPVGPVASTDVQRAIQEVAADATAASAAVQTALNNHISDASDAHAASAVSFDPVAASMVATDVQAAIEEIKAGSSGDVSAPSAFANDNRLIRSDGTGKNVQASTVVVSDTGDVSGIAALTVAGVVSGVSTPVGNTDAANKAYVDGIAANLGRRARVRAATTANITISTALNNGDTLDSVSLVTGDLVLVKNQSTTADNGIYVVGVTPVRAAEFDAYDEHPGTLVAVAEGSTNADTLWLCMSNDGGTLGSTAIAFSKMVVAGELLAANNLSDVASASTARSNLGLVIGTDVQAYDAALSSLVRQNRQSTAYTIVATDSGYDIFHPDSDNNARTFTIPANSSVAFPVGTVLCFTNMINTLTIAITSDTLTFLGPGSTGSRTLAANGMAVARKVTSTKWVITGVNLT